MMRAYNYFLYRIYKYYKDKERESDFQALFGVTAVSTTIISINLFSLYGIADFFDFAPMLENKYYTIFIMLIIGLLNHYFFIHKKKFLNYGFDKDKKGGILILIYVIISAAFAIIGGYYNREKIFEERRKNPPAEQIEKRPSLEGKIRKWFEEN